MKKLFALFMLLCLQTSLAMADTSPTAQQATRSFYAWYLEAFSKDEAPLQDNLPEMKKYVADTLLADLRKQMDSEDGLEEDYFTKSQDYDDSWLKNIKVTEQSVKGNVAIENVMLGTTQDNANALSVQLTKGANGWRISKVDGVATEAQD
ncbi:MULTISPECIES: DUF3828 domain-containing protein [unclassified Pseudomonas]|uniref:DUF3828 domain-containing protein n=1 Tax=unclassified Pseudomonas TaxID=196821 RepID=UPI000BC71FB7|nr:MULTISPECIES: DUF3828 domain-containing protein [unclassified Pseudomonas]PVZ10333.1 uncharacterized protein DUF3828 [Pseudomonas sp. URIL14HWK12:I12]PVZ21759.1 uncharacterized protein DUF3828 [Pseudomonas sp. URIL14HWK12:I10]PVZ31158.1 uncharacterized protein DUF3828 [Pseudomonas sp. URIL14HWK12:I11]SNZ17905.1 Protein of unknown function [Pseudomonas sp. URIL14HWK12:I9]